MNIGAGDIVDGNHKLILGLIWSIILHWQVRVSVYSVVYFLLSVFLCHRICSIYYSVLFVFTFHYFFSICHKSLTIYRVDWNHSISF